MRLSISASLGATLVSYLAGAAPMLDIAHDRVQTTLDPGLERIGTLTPRDVRSVGRSNLAVGCEMLPRGYADFEAYKDYLPPLGIVRVRLHAGWAKLEPKPGEWDFSWLDRQVNWLQEHGLEPLLETSYGNPAYPGAGGASLADGMPTGTVGLAAWDNFVDKLAAHYPNVKDWACWNEPNAPEAVVADNNIRTARIIRRHIPDARIGMLVIWCADLAFTKECFRIMRAQDALKLFHWAVYHDYSPNPDACYAMVDEWAAYVKSAAPHLRIWNGESGGTSDPHYGAPISSQKWNTELTQAKWDARRLIADLGHGYESLVFTMADPRYDNGRYLTARHPSYWVRSTKDRYMKRMGLLKCDDTLAVSKVKPAYYTVQGIASVFDADMEPAKYACRFGGELLPAATALYTFRHKKTATPLVAFWDASCHPENANATHEVTLTLAKGDALREPVWVDTLTCAIYDVPSDRVTTDKKTGEVTYRVPAYDAPALLTERSFVMEKEQ